MERSYLKPLASALFASLIIAGSYISIPLVPPVVLANFFALLSGLLLGPLWASLSVLVYLILGLLGLPVFAGGSSGLAYFMGPTGGFLVGYFLAALLAGFVSGSLKKKDRSGEATESTKKLNKKQVLRLSLAGLIGLISMYAVGLPWFQISLSDKYQNLQAAGLVFIPYFLGDLVKTAVAVSLALTLRPILVQLGFAEKN